MKKEYVDYIKIVLTNICYYLIYLDIKHMEIPEIYSPLHIWWWLDSEVFYDPNCSASVLKYYNHPACWSSKRLFLDDIREYHAIHSKYAQIWKISWIVSYGWVTHEFILSILDLWKDITHLTDSHIVLSRVPKIQWDQCVIGDVLKATRNALLDVGVPIENSEIGRVWHYLSAKNVHYMEENTGRLNIVVTDLWASIRESLQLERRLRKTI